MRERVLVIVVYYFTPSVQIYFEYKKKPKQSSLMMKNASPNIKGSSWQYYWHDKDFSHWVVHVEESGRSFVTTLGIIICGKKVLYLPKYIHICKCWLGVKSPNMKMDLNSTWCQDRRCTLMMKIEDISYWVMSFCCHTKSSTFTKIFRKQLNIFSSFISMFID